MHKDKILIVVKEIIYMLIALIISFEVFGIIIDPLTMRVGIPYILNDIMRFILAYAIYVVIKWIIYGSINSKHVRILYIIYFAILIYALTFVRGKQVYGRAFTLNLLEIFEQPIILICINICIFIPVGMYTHKFTKNIFKILIILLCPIFIEIVQLVFRFGIFDLGDILLNCIGGLLGMFINEFWIEQINTQKKTKRFKIKK